MTRPVTRDEVLDLTAYEKARPLIREQLLAVKAPRRVHLGDALTFLFENRDTVRYQVQEMVRAERMVEEEAIAHELETYNELLGRKGELGAALLIEIDDPAERAVKLREWMGLPGCLYVKTASWTEGEGHLRRPPGRGRAALLGPVPQVRHRGRGAGGGGLGPPAAHPRGGAHCRAAAGARGGPAGLK